MAAPKNLDTTVKNERKRIAMAPGRLVLEPRRSMTVPLSNGGGYAQMDQPGIAIETENIGSHHRGGTYTRLYDPAVPKDKEVLDRVEALLEERPDYATDVRFKIEIVGEFAPTPPWSGYDEQTAEQVETLYNAMPDSARPSLESVMKHELSRVDEDGNSITNDEKVKVLNKLYRAQDKAVKEQADMGAQL